MKYIKYIIFFTLISCVTSNNKIQVWNFNEPPEKPSSISRLIAVEINNKTNRSQVLGFYGYNNKNEVLGKSNYELFEVGPKYLLERGESITLYTDKKGACITYEYNGEVCRYGKRNRWRPGSNRKVKLIFDFRTAERGYLIQMQEL